MNAPAAPISRRTNLDPALARQTAPLPVGAYFDGAWYAQEMRALYSLGPNYVGHASMVPGKGDYRVLPAGGNRKVLVHHDGGVALLSNVCRHRQAQLLQGHGHVRSIVCPVHHWTYATDGRLLGAPDFDRTPDCRLAQTPLQDWQGLLFAGPRDVRADMRDFPLAAEFDYSGYVFDKATVETYPFNWKAFLEIYVELYHVEAVHPGLRRWVDCDNYAWGFGERWSYQAMGVKDERAIQPSPHYARYRDALRGLPDACPPKYGAIWATIYPNVMLELYPSALIVSSLIPHGPDSTTNIVEFYYPEEIQAFERDVVEAHQAAYGESAVEDAEICLRLHEGRRALWLAGEDDAGPYHSPHEDGVVHMHDWIRKEMEGPGATR